MLQKTQEFLSKSNINADEVNELRDIIRYHDKQYYIDSTPEIADQDYDKLFRLLKDFEHDNPAHITPDSPTQRLSQNIQASFQTEKHIVSMLSLDNTYNETELADFDRQISDKIPETKYTYVTELKFDGVSISIHYKNGILTRALTRGNGTEGENVTANIKTINSIPLKIDTDIPSLEVRGEIMMTKEVLYKINANLEEQGLKTFANTRNAASGAIRQLDPNITRKRCLDAYFYSLYIENDNKNLSSHVEMMHQLKNWGFHISPYLKTSNSIDIVIKQCIDQEEKRNSYPFDIDGLVIKINELKLRSDIGFTAHHPKWAIAYKFPAEQVKTKVLDIRIQVGRTGVLTPVAILEPVFLSGVKIGKATLHNQDEITRKDIRIGDTVTIERAGEVIPSVLKVNLEERNHSNKPFIVPKNCPICNSKTDKLPEEVAIKCLNINCPAQIKRRLAHYCSKNCLDIEGMGNKIVDRFVDEGIIKEITDIYKLEKHALKLSTQSGFGAKSIQNLLKSIEESKSKEVWKLIHGIGIKYVGKQASKILASNIDNLLDITKLSEEELMELPDIGDKTAKTIFEYFGNAENIKMIETLRDLNVNISSKSHSNDKILANTNFVVTGTFENINRSQIEKLVEDNGGNIQSQVSSKTDYLIAGINAGSKLKKANNLEIKILNINSFFELAKVDKSGFESKNIEKEQNSLF